VNAAERFRRTSGFAIIVAMVLLHAPRPIAAPPFTPARYVSGQLPVAPVLAVSGGEVFLEVHVTAGGGVDSIRPLRETPAFTDAVVDALRGWRFAPATEPADAAADQTAAAFRPAASVIFVAAMFAPPALNGPTLGTPPRDVLAPSEDLPLPTNAVPASYPVRAMGNGTVLVEVTLNETGALADARVRVSSPGFDAAAMSAARSWSFRPGRRNGAPSPSRAYLLFGFRPPVGAGD